MDFAAVILSAVVGASAVQFEARHEDVITLRGGQVLRGVVTRDQSDDQRISIQVGRGTRTVSRSDVIQHVPRMSLEEAHDEVAARLEPGDARSWRLLAEECLRKTPPLLGRAAADLRRSIAAQPMDEGAHELLVSVLVRQGDTEDALRAADEFAKTFPRSARPPFAAAGALIAAGRDPTGKLDESIRLGATAAAHLMRARWEVERGNVEDAEAALDRAAALGAAGDDVAFARARLALAKNDLPAAEAAYRALVANAPVERRSDVSLGLGAALLLMNRPEEADRVLAGADVLDDRVTWTRALVRMALAAADPQAAERAVESVVRSGGPGAALLNATQQYRRSGDAASALASVERAQGSQSPQAAVIAGWLAVRSGDLDRARAHYERAAAERPAWAEPRLALGALELRRDRPEAAARQYMAALEAVGSDSRLLSGLALAQIAMGEYADARASLSLATTVGPLGAEAHLARGYLAYLDGDHARALAEYLRAVRADDGAADAVAAAMPALAANAGMTAEFTAFTDGQIPQSWQVVGRTSAAVRSGRLHIDGAGEVRRRLDAGAFRSFSASFSRPASMRAGVAIETRRGRIELAVDSLGMASYRVREDSPDFSDWRPIGGRVLASPVSLAIELTGNADGTATFFLRANDEAASFATRVFFWNERSADAFVFAQGPAAADDFLLLEAARGAAQ